jgi:hypothetical protein
LDRMLTLYADESNDQHTYVVGGWLDHAQPLRPVCSGMAEDAQEHRDAWRCGVQSVPCLGCESPGRHV